MLTTDDLKKIKGVIRGENDSIEKKLRKVIREEISGSETKIRGEITSLETKMEHRFNAVDKRFDRIEDQMKEDRKDWSEFFNQAGIFFDEMRTQLSKRIKKLEDNQRAKN
jgi:hypothetical protein